MSAAILAVVLVGPGRASAQSNSLVPRRDRVDAKQVIPKEQMPPPGMCRIWLSDVPPDKQPAPTDCRTAIKNRPPNGRVIFGEDEDARGRARRDRGDSDDGKRKPKKP